MKRGMWALVALLCTLAQTQAADFWNGAVHYDPPFTMPDGPAGITSPTNGWRFSPTGSGEATHGIAEVEFRIETAETFIDKAPGKEIRTVADLKHFTEDQLRTATHLSYNCSLIEVDTRPALCCISRTNQASGANRPTEWTCSVCFFWQTNRVWRNSTLCEVMISAEKRETFWLLTNSLKTIKVHPQKLRRSKD